jgi:hypothetical protein
MAYLLSRGNPNDPMFAHEKPSAETDKAAVTKSESLN